MPPGSAPAALRRSRRCALRVPFQGLPVISFCAPRFCPGSFTEEQALRAAVATWPPGIRPVVHWSESQEGRKAHAHSDFIEARTLPTAARTEMDEAHKAHAR